MTERETRLTRKRDRGIVLSLAPPVPTYPTLGKRLCRPRTWGCSKRLVRGALPPYFQGSDHRRRLQVRLGCSGNRIPKNATGQHCPSLRDHLGSELRQRDARPRLGGLWLELRRSTVQR